MWLVYGKGNEGGLPYYMPTGWDQRIQAVYRDWVHSNDRAHLSGGVDDDLLWNKRWCSLAVISVMALLCAEQESRSATRVRAGCGTHGSLAVPLER